MSSVATLIAGNPQLIGVPCSIRLLTTHPAVGERTVGSIVRSLFYTARTAGIIAVRRPDIVHLFVGPRGSLARKTFLGGVARRSGSHVLAHMHSGDIDLVLEGGPAPGVPRERLASLIRRSDIVAVLWPLRADPALVGDTPVRVVPNPVEPLPAPPARERTVDVTWLGRLVPEKNVTFLAEIVEELAPAKTGLRVVIAGEPVGAQGERAAQRMRAAGAELPGWVARDEALALLADTRVLFHPSARESLPMSVLEAGASGCAVVAGPVTSLPYLLGDGRGTLVGGSDPVDWALAVRCELDRVAAQPDEIPGPAFRDFVRDQYATARAMAALGGVYAEMLAGARR